MLRTLGLLLDDQEAQDSLSSDRRPVNGGDTVAEKETAEKGSPAKNNEGVGGKETGEFIANWGPTVEGSVLEAWSEGKPFWWIVKTLSDRVMISGGADTRDSARDAALQAIENRQGPESEGLIRRDLERHVRAYGPYHASVAYDLNRLFFWLLDLNGVHGGTPRLAEAEEAIRRALAVTEKISGRDSENWARGLANLALILRVTDREAESEEAYTEAVRILEKALGPNHPDTQEVRECLEGLDR